MRFDKLSYERSLRLLNHPVIVSVPVRFDKLSYAHMKMWHAEAKRLGFSSCEVR